jgi:hypothetical protein
MKKSAAVLICFAAGIVQSGLAQGPGLSFPNPAINVLNYGAQGDAQVSGAVNCYTPTTTTLTCSKGIFVLSDAGKSIEIPTANMSQPSPAPISTFETTVGSIVLTSVDNTTGKFETINLGSAVTTSVPMSSSVPVTWGTDNSVPFQTAANTCPQPTNSSVIAPFTSKGCVIIVPNPGSAGTGDYMFGSGVTLSAQTSFEILGMGNSSKYSGNVGSQQAGVRLITAMPITILTVGQSTPGNPNYGGFHLDNITFRDTSQNGSALGALLMYNMNEAVIAYCEFENFYGETADPANDGTHTFPNIQAYGMKANPVGGTNNYIVLLHDKGTNNAIFYDSSIFGQDGPTVIGGDVLPNISAPANPNTGFTLPCYGFINAGPIQMYGTHFDTGANNNISPTPPPCWAMRMLSAGVVKGKFESSSNPHGSGIWLQGGSTQQFTSVTLTRSANLLYVSSNTIAANTLEQGEMVGVSGSGGCSAFNGNFILTSSSGSTNLTWDQPGAAGSATCIVTGIVTNASTIEALLNNLATPTATSQGSIQIDTAASNNNIIATIPSLSNPIPSFVDNGTNDIFEIVSGQAIAFTAGSQTTSSGNRTIFSGTLQVPSAAGVATTINGQIGYDVTAQVPHMAVNSADAKVATFAATATPTTGNCVSWASSTQVGDAGAGSPLGCNNAVLTFYCNGPFLASTAAAGLTPGSSSGNCQTTTVTEIPVPFAGTVRNLYVTAASGGAAGGGTVKVYHTTVGTSLACSLGTLTSCNDLAMGHAFTVSAGDTISIRVTTIASDTPTSARASVQLQ